MNNNNELNTALREIKEKVDARNRDNFMKLVPFTSITFVALLTICVVSFKDFLGAFFMALALSIVAAGIFSALFISDPQSSHYEWELMYNDDRIPVDYFNRWNRERNRRIDEANARAERSARRYAAIREVDSARENLRRREISNEIWEGKNAAARANLEDAKARLAAARIAEELYK